MSDPAPILSIVIPTLDEAGCLPRLLQDIGELTLPVEVIVSDGGSGDATTSIAAAAGCRVTVGPAGRGSQLNAGAALARAPWLLFLHADSRLALGCDGVLTEWLEHAPPNRVAHFRFELEGDDWFWRFIELGQRIRARLSGLVYGDQGLLVSREQFDSSGGYTDVPLMEDADIIRRLRRVATVEELPISLFTSPRRYVREGRWTGWFRNVGLQLLYLIGVPPARLERWYRPHGKQPDTTEMNDRILVVFAKAPVPGRVKTRLARDIGDEAAAEAYREMGRSVVDRLRFGPFRTIVYCDPPAGMGQVREWLGEPGLEFRAQADGDLGQRLRAACDEALQEADAVCVVGSDIPELGAEHVVAAFDRLSTTDAVFGPATDGGYYLIALHSAYPEFFRDIPWSTSTVLEQTLRQAQSLGLTYDCLEPLSDVDTVQDLFARLP